MIRLLLLSTTGSEIPWFLERYRCMYKCEPLIQLWQKTMKLVRIRFTHHLLYRLPFHPSPAIAAATAAVTASLDDSGLISGPIYKGSILKGYAPSHSGRAPPDYAEQVQKNWPCFFSMNRNCNNNMCCWELGEGSRQLRHTISGRTYVSYVANKLI